MIPSQLGKAMRGPTARGVEILRAFRQGSELLGNGELAERTRLLTLRDDIRIALERATDAVLDRFTHLGTPVTRAVAPLRLRSGETQPRLGCATKPSA